MRYEVTKDRFATIGAYVKGKRVLDIGCVDARPDGTRKYRSTGLHLFLKEHASFLLGADIDDEGVQQMKREGYNVIHADVETMDLGEQFDCIIAGEVIEHLNNPGLFLSTVKKHLSDDGVIILTTPNVFNVVNFYRVFRDSKVKVHPGHTCWYDPVTLSQLLKRFSFETEKILFTNKRKWYNRRYFYKLKYQIPRLISSMRPYFSGTIIAIARNSARGGGAVAEGASVNVSEHGKYTERPLVSVVVPAYNHEQYISECILSILAQDYPNIDLIVINDGSTDNTDQKIRELHEKNPGRFRYVRKTNEGLVKTLNLGLMMSQGEYFCELASDDLLLPQSISERVNYLASHPEKDAVFADAFLLNGSVKTDIRLSTGQIRYDSTQHSIKDLIEGKARILFPSGMLRASILKRLGGFDNDFRDYEDIAMKFQLALHANIGYLDKPVMYYRRHLTNTSAVLNYSRRKEKVLALEKLLLSDLRDIERNVKQHLYREYLKYVKFSLGCSIGTEHLASILMRSAKARPFAIKVWYYFLLLKLRGKAK